MFKTNLFISAVLLALGPVAFVQEVIDLTSGKKITAKTADDQQQEITDKKTGNRTVYNVNRPSITIYKPIVEKSNGIAILVCPGGAFHILDIDNEGYNVAKILSGKGYTVVVLKYRLVPLYDRNPFGALQELAKDFTALERKMAKVIPSSIEDTKTAFRYIKDNAPALGINADKVGIIGFSAGGTLATGLGYEADAKYRPAFFAPIYPYLSPFDKTAVPAEAAPIFIAVAEDDDFGFDANSLKLYQKWKGAGALAELHIYAKGKHGFGTKKQNLPVDSWMERLLEWLNFLEKDQRSKR
jgi:acetyl esterase/lipase